MSRKQWLLLIVLGIANLVVLCALGLVIAGALPIGAGPGQAVGDRPPSVDLSVPSPTATLLPTATPTSTPIPTQPLPTSTPRPPRDNEASLLNEIEQQVSALRGLDVLQPVPRWVLTSLQFRRRLDDMTANEQAVESARSFTLAMSALDLLAPDADLPALSRGIMAEQGVTLYEIDEAAIYIISDRDFTTLLDRKLFAHVFGYALQDQHFDLRSLGLSGDDFLWDYNDYSLAVQALVGGDARLIAEQWIERSLTIEEIFALQYAVDRAPRTRFDAAPRVVREMLLFPYVYGQGFVTVLYERGGWAMVNGAYIVPPTSSAQIMHPERYLAGTQPMMVSLPDMTDALGGEWQLVFDRTLGEFLLRLHLETRLEPEWAAPAAEGWNGDRCMVYHDPATGALALALGVAWDTPGEADQFVAAYYAWAEDRFGRPADVLDGARACWQDAQSALCVAWHEQMVNVARAPGLAMVYQLLGIGE